MIDGAHVVIYSKDTEAAKAFTKDVLNFKYIDVHAGWLIFKLPPSEVAVHPSDENDLHEFYLTTNDLDVEIAGLKNAGVDCEEPSHQSWGRTRRIQRPGTACLDSINPAPRAPRRTEHATGRSSSVARICAARGTGIRA